jgi:hypothetical protein
MKGGGFVSIQHLLWDREKKNQGKTSSRWLVTGRFGSLPTFSQQPAIQICQL